MTDSKTKVFKVLSEKVSGKDLFTDKTHEKITNTIYDFICLNEDKALSIGLEGPWGSGKTHILDLLKKKFEENKKKETYFFSFDGWAHEGDPLRKAFLDRLINYFEIEHPDNEFTEEIKIKVLKNTQESKEKIETHFSLFGMLLGIATIIAPVGAAILSTIDFAFPFTEESLEQPNYYAATFFFITVSPILVIIFGLIKKIFNKEFKFNPLISQPDSTLSRKIVFSDEKTSFEFGVYFQNIIEELSESNESFKRLIIAVDNLDRMSGEDAKQLWTTFQTFFQHRCKSNDSETWEKHVIFIVPFDRDGLENLWFKLPESVSEKEGERYNSSDLTKSFIEKNFEVIFEVPSPLISQWYELFNYFCGLSFQGWEESDVEIIKNVFRRNYRILKSDLSPRSIRSYINQVGINWMRWGSEVSLKAISIYSLLRMEYSAKSIKNLLATRNLSFSYKIDLTLEEEKELSGIICGVDKNKGLEVIISEFLKDVFLNGEADKFLDVVIGFDHLFPIIWNNISTSVLPSHGASEEFVIGATDAILMNSDKFINREWFKNTVNELYDGWIYLIQGEKLNNPKVLMSLELILSLDESKKLINEMKRCVVNLTNKAISRFEDEKVKFDLELISKIIDILRKYDVSYKPNECQELNVQRFIKWLKISNDLKLDKGIIRPSKNIGEELIENINKNNTIDNDLLNVFRVAFELKIIDEKTDEIFKWIEDVIYSEQERSNFYLLLYLLYVYGDNFKKEKVREVVLNAKFTESIKRNKGKFDCRLTLIIILCYGIAEFETFQFKGFYLKYIEQPLDTSIFNEVLNDLKKCNSLDVVWYLATQKSDRLGIGIIRKNLKIDNSILFKAKDIKKYLTDINGLTEEEIQLVKYKLT